jgi:hypothetical protein
MRWGDSGTASGSGLSLAVEKGTGISDLLSRLTDEGVVVSRDSSRSRKFCWIYRCATNNNATRCPEWPHLSSSAGANAGANAGASAAGVWGSQRRKVDNSSAGLEGASGKATVWLNCRQYCVRVSGERRAGKRNGKLKH